MSIQEKIDAAWKSREAYHAVTTSPVHPDLAVIAKAEFTAGYMAALRGLYPETPVNQMEFGVEYIAKIKTDRGIRWSSCLMLSLSDNSKVCEWSRDTGWSYWGRSAVVLAVDKKAATRNLPSPSEVFGEEVG